MGLGDPTTCVYQFILDENDINYKKIIQYFIIHVLVLCIKLDIFVVHMLYAWSFIHNTELKITINKNKNFLSLNTYTAFLIGELIIRIKI